MTLEDFKKEVIPLANKIYRFAKRFMNMQVEAEDITQDVMLKLWSKKEELVRYNSVEALAMTTTKNLCLDRIKYNNIRNSTSPEAEISTNINPLKQTEVSDELSMMNSIINRLPKQQKMIVQLREIEGYEFEEIVTITGLNLNSVRVNLTRARKKIKEELTKVFNYGLK